MFEIDDNLCTTGITPGLTFDETVDRYWHKLPLEKQKQIIKNAYAEIRRLRKIPKKEEPRNDKQ